MTWRRSAGFSWRSDSGSVPTTVASTERLVDDGTTTVSNCSGGAGVASNPNRLGSLAMIVAAMIAGT